MPASPAPRKQAPRLGGGDVSFYGDYESGFLTAWLETRSRQSRLQVPPAGPAEWGPAPVTPDGALVPEVPAGHQVALRLWLYAGRTGDYYLEFPYSDFYDSKLEFGFTAGDGPQRNLNPDAISLTGPFPSLPFEAAEGWTPLTLAFFNPTGAPAPVNLRVRLIDAFGRILPESRTALEPGGRPSLPAPAPIDLNLPEQRRPAPRPAADPKPDKAPDLEGFRPGVGPQGIRSAGRFGFTKGDGLLDCSLPALGVIAKPYLFGHPDYRKNLLWHFSTVPPGVPDADQFRSSRWEIYRPGRDETVTATWTGAAWRTVFIPESSFYTRQAGRPVAFECRYSTLHPAVLVTTDDDGLRLSRLQAAGNYRQLLLPLAGGLAVRNCRPGRCYDRQRDGDLAGNWALLFNGGAFPEVPLQIVFEKQPDFLFAQRDPEGNLEFLDIVSGPLFGRAALLFPFGFEVFRPEALADPAWLDPAAARCQFWSRSVPAYPAGCQEYYRVAPDRQRVDIVQRFEYQILSDAWQTQPLEIAPLPPPLGLLGNVAAVARDPRAMDLQFPTKYGPLWGVPGRGWSGYSLPLPPTRRRFSLAPAGDDAIAGRMDADFDEYLRYHRERPELPNPGAYHFLIQYAIPLCLFPYLKPDPRGRLEAILRDGLAKACDPAREYRGPGGRTCVPWYERTEPFSGVRYRMTYLHVGGIRNLAQCDPENIARHPRPFIEVDWGNGFALYAIYLAALLTGDWSEVRRHWDTLKQAFDYYLVCMDWACMASGYSENGVTWNDGTNYGGYIGFARMAELLGDGDAHALALYALAKQAALRLAQFQSSSGYFCRFFNRPPWWNMKFFHDEFDGRRAFTNYPARRLGRYRPGSLYNLTTEGHYPEAWALYPPHLPGAVRELLEAVDEAFPDLAGPLPEGQGAYHSETDAIGTQELLSAIMLNLLSGRRGPDRLLALLEQADANRRLSREFMSIPAGHRRIPAAWAYSYLKSQIESAGQPALSGWMGVRIGSARYDAGARTAVLEIEAIEPDAWIEGIGPLPLSARLNGRPQAVKPGDASDLYRIPLPGSGRLVLTFQPTGDCRRP